MKKFVFLCVLCSSTARAEVFPDRITFTVIESFDTQYPWQRDKHVARSGHPHFHESPAVGIRDAVYKGGKKVGVVNRVVWNRERSIDIEFAPDPGCPVLVGDAVTVMRQK